MSKKFNLSFRRSEKKAFRNIAHGLIPAATIAPRPAVPRTPPPRSPNPSPERPRSALAAAILSSSLTGRTVAIPPPRARSYSESDCSHSDTHTEFEPFASTALYTRDKWPDSMVGRPRLPSPGQSGDEESENDEEVVGREVFSDEGHMYESLEGRGAVPVLDPVYAVPLKKSCTQSEEEEETEDSVFDVVSPLQTEDTADDATARSLKETAKNTLSKKTSSLKKGSVRERDDRSEASLEHRQLMEEQGRLVRELKAKTEALERRCSEQTDQLQRLEQELRDTSKNQAPPAGESAELQSLRQQGQELVDENDGLKMTVHRLSAELSRYQTCFRPLAKEEMARTSGLPMKGPAPPWLLDMKYLSPLLLAYEDQLAGKDALFKSCEEELRRLKSRTTEVVQENERLHKQLEKSSAVSQKEWKQLQDQARLVLQENQVLIEQLELQHVKAKETHSRHTQEVSKVAKQVMLLEADKQSLEQELQEVRRELHALRAQHQQACTSLKNAVSWEEHTAVTAKLKRQLEEEERRKGSEVEELLGRLSALQEERKTLVLEKTNLSAEVKSIEVELEQSRQANRRAQRRIGMLKQQVEESLEKEMMAHQYLSSIVTLAEKTTQERDQLVHMASALERDKQGVLTRIIDGTVRLGKLQEKVKVFRKQAAVSVGVMGQKLQEQEQDFAGRAACFQREIQHLQKELKTRQEALDGALQQRREVENELEVVWEAATRENQRIREVMLGSSRAEGSPSPAMLLPPQCLTDDPSPSWALRHEDEFSPQHRPATTAPPAFTTRQSSALPERALHRSPAFESDSDQHQNPSSDESEKNGLDFYS
ncbi:centrosomal protein of 89 kDa [Chanos chanos]|uniref:Centrosomal protein of 89 kDa n=1 Tax=Chanos chanos TaxID=29144 RepID=A0A6J2X0M7_CHACN|nr:centrosomal protein of 89 kDa [Chanos chanos]